MTDLKPCPFCSAKPEIWSDSRRTWGLVQHEDWCLFPSFRKHEIPEGDFAAWNARADSYTREDVESAFVSGYSLGTLPVGSDPRWDQNETTLEEEMEELGWVRERTCRMETAEGCQNWNSCSECDADYYTDQPINYCPNCGARVVSE